MLASCAAEAGLDAEALPGAVSSAEVKLALREGTDRAWEAGVRGVPSLRIGTRVFWGDDRLEQAAAYEGRGHGGH